MRYLHLVLFSIIVCGCSGYLAAQVPTGVPPFSSVLNDGFDTVDLANLNAQFAVPILAKPGRGGFNFSYIMTYDSSVWYPVTVGTITTWTMVQGAGWKGQTQVSTGYMVEKTWAR